MLMRIATSALILLVIVQPAALHAGQGPGVTITPIISAKTTTSREPIDVPAHPEVIVSRYEIAPNAALPMHQHPYPRYAYVLSGTLEIAVLGGKISTYKAGDFIVEAIGQWHAAVNVGNTPVRLLVIDQVVPGHSNTIFRSDKAPDTATRH